MEPTNPLAGVDLATPAGVRTALAAFGLRLRPSRSQHFLVNPRVLQRIIEAAELGPNDVVLEIGAGIGTLTVALARTGARVIAIEVDARFIPIARAACAPYPGVRLIHGDAMRLDPAQFPQVPTKVVANLPYSIASPLLVNLVTDGIGHRYVVMVQREVANRIVARPGSRTYGLLSVMLQARASASIVQHVPSDAFFPAPEVDSCVVRLDLLDPPPVEVAVLPALRAVARAAFRQRRKMLRSALQRVDGWSLSADMVERICADAGIDVRLRGERLSVQDFATLAGALMRLGPPVDQPPA